MKRFWQWMLKAGYSILDQGLLSTSNFILNIFLARVLSREDFGAFSVAFTVLLVIGGVHNALLVEPMSVLGPARHLHEVKGYLRGLVSVHFGLTGGITLLSGAISFLFWKGPLGPAMLAMSLTSVLILLFWMVRRAHYLEVRPDLAAISSGVYSVSLAGVSFALWRAGWLTPSGGFVAMALAGAIAVVFSFTRFGIGLWPGVQAPPVTSGVWQENWNFGRWILPSALFYPLLSQIQMFLTGAYLGLGEAGVLRAISNPILPVMQVVTALATLAVPVLSREFSRGRIQSMYRRGLVYMGAMIFIAIGYEAAVLGSGNLWDRLLYNGRYASHDWLMPVLGLMPIAFAAATGCSVLLRAIQRPELTMITHVCGGIFGGASSFFLIEKFGLAGAVYGLVGSHVVTALASVVITIAVRRPEPSSQKLASMASGD